MNGYLMIVLNTTSSRGPRKYTALLLGVLEMATGSLR
jgi:hypothetical protein